MPVTSRCASGGKTGMAKHDPGVVARAGPLALSRRGPIHCHKASVGRSAEAPTDFRLGRTVSYPVTSATGVLKGVGTVEVVDV